MLGMGLPGCDCFMHWLCVAGGVEVFEYLEKNNLKMPGGGARDFFFVSPGWVFFPWSRPLCEAMISASVWTQSG